MSGGTEHFVRGLWVRWAAGGALVNNIGDAGASALAEVVNLNTTITSVNLGSECRARRRGAMCTIHLRGMGAVCQSTVSVTRARRQSRRR